ncbi:MAG: hypothetical protein H8E44_02855 [Planctomycetes bacterium]|nr:hypothetical protein [Planctomycetota bacterium]MBL7041458.1 hypothetical protein [Pirellulaceae bacterium]
MRCFGVKAIVACCVLSLVALTHTLGGSAAEQENAESPAPKTMGKKRAQKPKTAPKKAGGRLPRYYGQIGLSDEQRGKVYEVQRTYREQIEELRKQLKAIEAKQKEEISEVLTEEQKAKLAELIGEPKKKRSPPSKKKKSGT